MLNNYQTGCVQIDHPCSAAELYVSVHVPKQDGCFACYVIVVCLLYSARLYRMVSTVLTSNAPKRFAL